MLPWRELYLASFYLLVLGRQALSLSYKAKSVSVMKPGEETQSNSDLLHNGRYPVGFLPTKTYEKPTHKGQLKADDIGGTMNDPSRPKRLRMKRTISSGGYDDSLYSMGNKQYGSSDPYSYPESSYTGSSFPKSSYSRSSPYPATKPSSHHNGYESSRGIKSKAGYSGKYSGTGYGKSKPEAKQYRAPAGRGGYNGYGPAQQSGGYPATGGYSATKRGNYGTGTNAGGYAPTYAPAVNRNYGTSSGNYYPSASSRGGAAAPQQAYYQPSHGGAAAAAPTRYYPSSSSGKTAPAYYPSPGGGAATQQQNYYAPSSAQGPSSGYYPPPAGGKNDYPLDPATVAYAGSVGGGYPASSGGYPSQSGGYPSQSGGYPSQSGGYPASSGGYPSQSGSYPAQSGGYPSQSAAGYPSQSAGYPAAGGGYPASAGYPASSGAGGYPAPAGPYPGSAGGGYPAPVPAGGYPGPGASGGYPAPGGYPAQNPPYIAGTAADPYPDAYDEKALAKAIGKVLKKASAERKEKRAKRKAKRRRRSSKEGKSSRSRELKGDAKMSSRRRSRDEPRPSGSRERTSRRRSRRRENNPTGRNFESSKEIPTEYSAEELPEMTSTSTEQDGSKSNEVKTSRSAERDRREREEDMYNKETRRRTAQYGDSSAEEKEQRREVYVPPPANRTPYHKISATMDGKANAMISGLLGNLFKTAMSNHEAEAKAKARNRYTNYETPPATKIVSNLDKLNTMLEAMSSKLNKMSNDSGNRSRRKESERFERSPS